MCISAKTSVYDSQIELFKIPKDAWLQTIDSITTAIDANKKREFDEEEEEEEESAKPAASSIPPPNIAKPQSYCKIKPPQNQFKFLTVNTSNVVQVFKSVENSLDTIGLGVNNCFSRLHLEAKNQLAEKAFNIPLNDDAANQITGGNYDLARV